MSRLAIFFGFFASSGGGFGLEFLDATNLVYKALLASEEGVTLAADINNDAVAGRTSGKTGATTTGDVDLMVGRMQVGFHRRLL